MRAGLSGLSSGSASASRLSGTFAGRRALSLPSSASKRSLACRSTIRQPHFLLLVVRGIYLAPAVVFAIWLSLADWHYARGWPPRSPETGLEELHKAQALYPFMHRFRDGPALRWRIFVEQGL